MIFVPNTRMMENDSLDAFLFSEFKAGNPRAFDKLFRNLYPINCRYAYSIVHDHDKAQGLVQEVFVRLWEKRISLEHVTNLPSYLTSMVRNESLNYIRHEKKNIHLASLPSELKSEVPDEQNLFASDFTEKLIAALSNLPDRCREAFEMSRFENLTNKQIAEKMEISTKGVEALITRALKSLRHSLSSFLPSAREKNLKDSILFLLFRRIKDVDFFSSETFHFLCLIFYFLFIPSCC